MSFISLLYLQVCLSWLLRHGHAPGFSALQTMHSFGVRSHCERFVELWMEGTTCNLPLELHVLVSWSPCMELLRAFSCLFIFVGLLSITWFRDSVLCAVQLHAIDLHFDPIDLCRPSTGLRASREKPPTFVVFCRFANSSTIRFLQLYIFFLLRSFDHTLGFPGEGPDIPHHWTISSANIGTYCTNNRLFLGLKMKNHAFHVNV